jgi:hypothetical protein
MITQTVFLGGIQVVGDRYSIRLQSGDVSRPIPGVSFNTMPVIGLNPFPLA